MSNKYNFRSGSLMNSTYLNDDVYIRYYTSCNLLKCSATVYAREIGRGRSSRFEFSITFYTL